MMKKYNWIFHIPALLIVMALTSCGKKTTPAENGSLTIFAEHTVDGTPAVFDDFIYVNEAGNQYAITEIQWFVTELTLIREDGTFVHSMEKDDAWYIDSDISESMQHHFNEIPEGTYTGLQFTFGFRSETNLSHRFVNPPESFMFWPQYLGGGYHYMKMNGKWLNENGLAEPFNFHLGIGQIYDSTASKSQYVDIASCCSGGHCSGYHPPSKILPVKEFVHNSFQVNFNDLDLIISTEKNTKLVLEMKIENWFKGIHTYDHNKWGGSIMQQQEAMRLGCENGRDVFRLRK